MGTDNKLEILIHSLQIRTNFAKNNNTTGTIPAIIHLGEVRTKLQSGFFKEVLDCNNLISPHLKVLQEKIQLAMEFRKCQTNIDIS